MRIVEYDPRWNPEKHGTESGFGRYKSLSGELARRAIEPIGIRLRERYDSNPKIWPYMKLGPFYEGLLEAGFPAEYILPGSPKTIVDIGCGSTSVTTDTGHSVPRDNIFEPWLCRTLHMLGEDITGVDAGDLSSEDFRYINTDLTMPNSLAQIPSRSVDIVNELAFFDSPSLGAHPSWRRGIKTNLFPEIERILKPGGVFVTSEHEHFRSFS